jgi:carbonic anhydrase
MIEKLIRGNLTFRHEYVAGARQFLERLASEGQSPGALFIGCSDSRVVPELLTSSSPGELFVVRNVANIVPPADERRSMGDDSVGAAVEYAIGVLGVEHVVVCGHYGCGGVRAVVERHVPTDSPRLAEWLTHAAPGAERAASRGTARLLDRAVEENVEEQLGNLASYPMVRERLDRGELQLHGWVYDLKLGTLVVWDALSDAFLPPDGLKQRSLEG